MPPDREITPDWTPYRTPDRTPDPWAALRATTRARIGLARTGDAMALHDVLDFQFAHARARDAVHAALDIESLKTQIAGPTIEVHSEAPDRETYLRRPDQGRRLHPDCHARLPKGDYDAVFVIADGLSATAVALNAAPMLAAIRERLPDWRIAPTIIATQARVAIGDDIAETLGATLCAILIGERPGLTVAESLGIYLTHNPKRGCRDSSRNCISNIHTKGGLPYATAADTLAWLMREARRLRVTGVGLKEEGQGLRPWTPLGP